MEKLKTYQTVLEYAQSVKEWFERDDRYEFHLIADERTGHIQLFKTSFTEMKFNFIVVFHFHIKEDGKVWVLVNHTEIELGVEFMKRGISSQKIVIGFIHPKYRQYSDYASA